MKNYTVTINDGAKDLKIKESKSIGLIIPEIENHFFLGWFVM